MSVNFFSGKRKSAVELLQESKAFYVKSETVLDRKQELKNSGHLQVSQLTAPGAPPRLLRKCNPGLIQIQPNNQQQLQQQQQPQIVSPPCCWATSHESDRRKSLNWWINKRVFIKIGIKIIKRVIFFFEQPCLQRVLVWCRCRTVGRVQSATDRTNSKRSCVGCSTAPTARKTSSFRTWSMEKSYRRLRSSTPLPVRYSATARADPYGTRQEGACRLDSGTTTEGFVFYFSPLSSAHTPHSISLHSTRVTHFNIDTKHYYTFFKHSTLVSLQRTSNNQTFVSAWIN